VIIIKRLQTMNSLINTKSHVVEYLSQLDVQSGPATVEISEQESSRLYTNAFTSTKRASKFSNTTKGSVSGVIKAVNIGIENETSYTKFAEDTEELRTIKDNNVFKSLAVKKEIKADQYSVTICKVAMINTDLGVLHVPKKLYHEIYSKDDMQNMINGFYVDDTWTVPLTKYGLKSTNLFSLHDLGKKCEHHTSKMHVPAYVKELKCITDSKRSKVHGLLKDHNGGSNDLNKGMGGDFTHALPKMTYNPSEAARGFQFKSESDEVAEHAEHGDYAKGAGGKFRYIIPVTNASAGNPIKWGNVKLCRGNTPQGWQHTEDINKKRGGDDLYVIWKN